MPSIRQMQDRAFRCARLCYALAGQRAGSTAAYSDAMENAEMYRKVFLMKRARKAEVQRALHAADRFGIDNNVR